VVVSSVTPLMPSPTRVQRCGSPPASERLRHGQDQPDTPRSRCPSAPGTGAGPLVLGALVHQQRRRRRRRRGSCSAGRAVLVLGPAQHLLGAPPVAPRASRPSTRTRARRSGPRGCRRRTDRDRPRPRGPGSRRCCTLHQRTSAPKRRQRLDQHCRLDRHVQRAGDPRAFSGWASAYSAGSTSAQAISCSASVISLRPKLCQ